MASSQFHIRLQAKVVEEMNKIGKEVILGQMTNYDDYRWYVGYLKGLGDSLKLADEVEKEMEG
jgi:hypothetical protein